MNNKLLDIIVYIFKVYPQFNELSKARLVKLIYLIDWKNSIDKSQQLTNIKWYFNHYGPYVDDVMDLIKERNDIFSTKTYSNYYGGVSNSIELINKSYLVSLSDSEKDIIDFIVKNTYEYDWNKFISLVYSTYPTKNNAKYSTLDLPNEAAKFRELKNTF